MPISEKQLEANRRNAEKSTGPRTEEGKKRSSINGMRNGLTGAAFLMTDEDRTAFENFSKPFIQDLKPVGPVEYNFAHLIAVAHFRLNRIHAIEENIFAMGHFGRAGDIETDISHVHDAFTQARVFAFESKTFSNLSLYEQRIHRTMLKNLKTLQELQAARKAEEQLAAREAEKPKAKSASAAPSEENGFGFSNRSGLIPTQANTQTEDPGQGFGFSSDPVGRTCSPQADVPSAPSHPLAPQ